MNNNQLTFNFSGYYSISRGRGQVPKKLITPNVCPLPTTIRGITEITDRFGRFSTRFSIENNAYRFPTVCTFSGDKLCWKAVLYVWRCCVWFTEWYLVVTVGRAKYAFFIRRNEPCRTNWVASVWKILLDAKRKHSVLVHSSRMPVVNLQTYRHCNSTKHVSAPRRRAQLIYQVRNVGFFSGRKSWSLRKSWNRTVRYDTMTENNKVFHGKICSF